MIIIIDVCYFNIKVFLLMILDINDFDLWFFFNIVFRIYGMIMYEMGIENFFNNYEYVFM